MRLLLLLSLLLAVPATAQTRGSCAAGTATGVLDAGDVRARVFINGNLFFGESYEGEYTVPASRGVAAIYAANLWVSGTVGAEVRTAGATYDRFGFRPGPLGTDGEAPADCAPHDRIYVVSTAHLSAYATTGIATPDLRDWPVQWGADYYLDANGNHRRDAGEPLLTRAPGDPGYGAGGAPLALAAGERPDLIGDQAAFWIMNDVAAPATALGLSTPAPIGIEVQVTAVAFGAPRGSAFQQATLYRFRLIKRSPGTLDDARTAVWLDPDLGGFTDDYAAVDTTRGMAITYNADNDDGGPGGYGLNPPAIGYDWLTGASAHVIIGRGSGSPRGDAFSSEHLYNYSRGLWRDGTVVREGGTGVGGTGAVTPWVYAGDPVTGAFWSERNIDGNGTANNPGDLKQAIASRAFTLVPGVPLDFVLAIPFGQGADHLDSVTKLRAASDVIQAAYDNGLLFPVDAQTGGPSPTEVLALSAPRPNPTTGGAEVTLALAGASAVRVTVVDALGRVVAVAHDGALAAGAQRIALPSGLPAGVYAVVAETDGRRATTRLSVVR